MSTERKAKVERHNTSATAEERKGDKKTRRKELGALRSRGGEPHLKQLATAIAKATDRCNSVNFYSRTTRIEEKRLFAL